MTTNIKEKVMAAVDRSLVVDVLTALVDTPSATGFEGPIAKLLASIYTEHGMNGQLQPIYEDRYNAIGRIKGTGGGPTVLFSGHLDTSISGDEDWLEGKGWKNKAVVVDNEWLYGNGSHNMKNGIAAALGAAVALKACGVKLPGDLIFAGTAGEVEMAPVDEFTGRAYDGYGMGMRHMITHGVAADFHILPEPSAMTPMLGMFGTVWAKITTNGPFSHTAFSNNAVSAIGSMRFVMDELDEWIADYVPANTFLGVEPKVNVAAVRGGLPWRLARTAKTCSLYIDVRIPPTRYPIDVQLDLERFIEQLNGKRRGMQATIEFYMARPGTLLSKSSPLVTTLCNAHSETTGKTVEASFSPPFCTDAIDSNRLGIPTLVYGAGGTRRPPWQNEDGFDKRAVEGEYVYIDDVVDSARVFAATAIDMCSMPREEAIRSRGMMPSVDLDLDLAHAH
jgi:acetylornithine deacetylase